MRKIYAALLIAAVGAILFAWDRPSNAQGGWQLQGATMYPILSAASNNSQMVTTAGPITIMGMIAINTAASVQYVRLYDTATAPDCTSATNARGLFPVQTAALNGGWAIPIGPAGATFVRGVGICITGAYGMTDNTAAVTGLSLTVLVK